MGVRFFKISPRNTQNALILSPILFKRLIMAEIFLDITLLPLLDNFGFFLYFLDDKSGSGMEVMRPS